MTTPASVEHQHTLATAVARYDDLRMCDLLAPAVAPDGNAPEVPPGIQFSQQEALELLALSQAIARKATYGRELTVRAARAAGASWSQTGAVLGTTMQAAWNSHSRWIEDQPGHPCYETLDDPRAGADREVDGDGEDLPRTATLRHPGDGVCLRESGMARRSCSHP
jgi:hypothetical protein